MYKLQIDNSSLCRSESIFHINEAIDRTIGGRFAWNFHGVETIVYTSIIIDSTSRDYFIIVGSLRLQVAYAHMVGIIQK